MDVATTARGIENGKKLSWQAVMAAAAVYITQGTDGVARKDGERRWRDLPRHGTED
jgi:hypothetical protein